MLKKITLSILFLCIQLCIAQSTLSGTVKNVDKVSWLLLKENYGTKSRVLAKTKPSENGDFIFILPDSLNKGIYELVYNLRENIGFEFYYNKESFQIHFDAHPELFDIQFVNNPESTWYYNQLNELHHEEYEVQVLNQFIQNYNPASELRQAAIDEYNTKVNTLTDKVNSILDRNRITAPLLVVQKQHYPNIEDDFLLQNYKRIQYFFDAIDATDSLLMHSKIYTTKVMEYISLYSAQNALEEDYIRAVDAILNWASPNKLLHAMLIDFLAEGFSGFDMPKVVKHIDVQYKAVQCSADENMALQDRLKAYERLAIGNKAPNFLLGNKYLYDLTTDYYVIAFWASWCGACEAILPSVNSFLEDSPRITSIAIGLDDNRDDWNNAKENYMNFIHIRAEEKWDNKIVKDYAIHASPSFYVLDKSHNIIGKAKNLIELRDLLPY